MTEPSAQARSAAAAIFQWDEGGVMLTNESEAAEIIERETGAGEAVEIIERLLRDPHEQEGSYRAYLEAREQAHAFLKRFNRE